MRSTDEIVEAVAGAADKWREPTFGARVTAIEETLTLPNTFTAEAIEFAVDQLMAELTREKLTNWVGGRRAINPSTVAVLGAGNIPLVEFQDWLAVTLVGHRFVGALSSRSNRLLPAFAATAGLGDVTRITVFDEALAQADVLVGTGATETTATLRERAIVAGLSAEQLLLRGSGFGVSVLTGSESSDDLLDLAEDCLLHEGRGCRNVAVVWVPAGTAPDRFLESAATFRGVFPGHPKTAAGLRIPKAMLEARGIPCAYADDLSFLVSRGPAEVLEPCHLRWCEYSDIGDPVEWIARQGQHVQVVTTSRRKVGAASPFGAQVARLGSAQRPPISWKPDGVDTIDFLTSF